MGRVGELRGGRRDGSGRRPGGRRAKWGRTRGGRTGEGRGTREGEGEHAGEGEEDQDGGDSCTNTWGLKRTGTVQLVEGKHDTNRMHSCSPPCTDFYRRSGWHEERSERWIGSQGFLCANIPYDIRLPGNDTQSFTRANQPRVYPPPFQMKPYCLQSTSLHPLANGKCAARLQPGTEIASHACHLSNLPPPPPPPTHTHTHTHLGNHATAWGRLRSPATGTTRCGGHSCRCSVLLRVVKLQPIVQMDLTHCRPLNCLN